MKKEKIFQLKREIGKGKTAQLTELGPEKGARSKTVGFRYKNHEIFFTPSELIKLAQLFADFNRSDKNPYATVSDLDALIYERFPEGVKPGEKVKAYRSREGLTQVQLAEASGVPQPHISQVEKGERPIGALLAKKLAKALNCDYRALL